MVSALYVGTCQALFVFLIMLSKRRKQLSDMIFSLWLLFLAYPIVIRLLKLEFNVFIPVLFQIKSFAISFGPFLWIYCRTLIEEKPGIKKSVWLHFLPFLLFTFLNIAYPELFPFPERPHRLEGFPIQLVYNVTTILSYVIYTVLVLLLLRRHRKKILNYFSYTSNKITLKWLQWLMASFVLAYIILTIYMVIFPKIQVTYPLGFENNPPPFGVSPSPYQGDLTADGTRRAPNPQEMFDIGFTFFIFALSFFAIRQPMIFRESRYENKKQETDKIEKERSRDNGKKEYDESEPDGKIEFDSEYPERKYKKSGLRTDQIEEFLNRLDRFMQDKKPFLDGNLTIQKLSKEVGIYSHYITQVINEKLNKNFYSYINGFRINEAKNLIINDKNKEKTFLTIAYDSGFNSKSVFYRIFKENSEMTPSQFRKLHNQQK